MGFYPDYYFNQSAVFPVSHRVGGGWEVMVVSSRKNRRWVIPKGIVALGMSAEESALKEAKEEAGLEGELLPGVLGVYQYPKWNGTCTVQVFVLMVERIWDQWQENYRRREWVSLEEARARLEEVELQEMLARLPAFIEEARRSV